MKNICLLLWILPAQLFSQNDADCYNEVGETDNCINDLFFIVRADSSNDWARNNLAFMLSSKSDFKRADSLYAISLKKTPRNAHVLSNYGYVKFKLGLVKEGKEMLEQSILIMPENAYAYHYLARMADEENNADAACDYAGKAIARGFTKSYGNAMAALQEKRCTKP